MAQLPVVGVDSPQSAEAHRDHPVGTIDPNRFLADLH